MAMKLDLLPTIEKAFYKYLETHPRSNEKLKILHAKISADLQMLLGNNYIVNSLGYGTGKEQKIMGRYIDKTVDITISKKNEKREQIIAGIAVKFVMCNYSQNSNNYFENMLGETANIRCSNIPYFQIFIIPEEMPYYNEKGIITKTENFTYHNVKKYIKLSEDNPVTFLHTPDKTLIIVIKLPSLNISVVNDKEKYRNSYKKAKVGLSSAITTKFGGSVILNDYEDFIKKITHRILSI